MSAARERYHFAQDADPHGLRAELAAAGVAVGLVNPVAGGVEVDVYPAEYDRAAAVVAAHDPAPYRQQKDEAQRGYDDAVAYLRQFEKYPSGSATNAQRDNAIKALTTIAKVQHQQLRDAGG